MRKILLVALLLCFCSCGVKGSTKTDEVSEVESKNSLTTIYTTNHILIIDAHTETLLSHKDDVSKITIKEDGDKCTITLASQDKTTKFIVGGRWLRDLGDSQTLVVYNAVDTNIQPWEIKILHDPSRPSDQAFALYFMANEADKYIVFNANNPIYFR